MKLPTPVGLGIQDVSALRQGWLDCLAGQASDDTLIEVDISAVPDVDAAGLQLLVSLARSAERAGRRLHLQGASETLARSLAEWHSVLSAHVEA